MKKILIVDDYPDILEGLSYVLKDHYEVTTAVPAALQIAGGRSGTADPAHYLEPRFEGNRKTLSTACRPCG